jgi:glutaminyl-tRNA synthetase
MSDVEPTTPRDFIRDIVADDLESGKNEGRVVTRFPPEPNGYLHIGNAWAARLSFDVASENSGAFNLRFDDTNPTREEQRYVDGQIEDLRWLGLDWAERMYFASDYFEQIYKFAEQLVRAGKAYVCDLSPEQIREYRGTLTAPGRNSPYRERSVDENLDLLARMRAGEFAEGSRVLRARIDMASGNMNLRDPVLYRIQRASHHRTGNAWSIYPTYDFAHPLSDSLEGITHSLCSLEFEDHRPLYDWLLDELGVYHPQQIEFARVALTHTALSKRVLRLLVEEEHVRGWDDPRMPTLAGLRRRGYTPEALHAFCRGVGVNKRATTTEMAFLEHCLREDLNRRAPRAMAVLEPLRVVIENYPEGQTEELQAINNPEDASMGTRAVPFSRELWIERDDFLEDPPRKFFRLAPGREVRLRYAYFVTCTDVVKDSDGNVVEVRCRYDPETRGGDAPDGRRVKGTLHWVSAAHAVAAEVRLYDHLFSEEHPGELDDFRTGLNPDSLRVLSGAQLEPALATAQAGARFQFERQGYFCADAETRDSAPVFNRTVALRDSWARAQKRGPGND